MIELIAALLFLPCAAAAAMPGYNWMPANEIYLTAPLKQTIIYSEGGISPYADTLGLGYRLAGDGQGVTKTAAVQLQRLTVSNNILGLSGTFSLLELLGGAEYSFPAESKKRLRWTASALADLGLGGNTVFMAPVLTAGLLYRANPAAAGPGGTTFTVYYRFTDITLHSALGQSVTLRPALGFRLGYLFSSFWRPR